VGITLKAARVNKNIKQEDAAKLMGISLSTLQNYEAGKTFPDVPVIKRIEELYDVEYKDIIFIP
jgi:transcriptional regulator with XRE-family HTH domain